MTIEWKDWKGPNELNFYYVQNWFYHVIQHRMATWQRPLCAPCLPFSRATAHHRVDTCKSSFLTLANIKSLPFSICRRITHSSKRIMLNTDHIIPIVTAAKRSLNFNYLVTLNNIGKLSQRTLCPLQYHVQTSLLHIVGPPVFVFSDLHRLLQWRAWGCAGSRFLWV